MAVKAGKKGFELVHDHPSVLWLPIGAVSVLGGIGIGLWQGFKMNIDLETTATVVDEGYGEIVAVDLDIEPKPLVGFTADVIGAKTVLASKLHLGPVTLPAGSNWVTLEQRIPTTINVDPAKIDIEYDPGKISDKTDDRIILNVPLDAFGIENTTDADSIMQEDYEFGGDLFTYPEKLVAAATQSMEPLKDVPGVGAVDDAVSEKQQTLLKTTKINMLNNVVEVCAPKFMENQTVYEAVHENLKDAVYEAVGSSEDPEIVNMRKNVEDWATMDVDAFIGAESDAQPNMPNQKLAFVNPYTDQMTKFKEDPEIQLESAGNFECELSDEVKEILGVQDDPTASPSASAEAEDE